MKERGLFWSIHHRGGLVWRGHDRLMVDLQKRLVKWLARQTDYACTRTKAAPTLVTYMRMRIRGVQLWLRNPHSAHWLPTEEGVAKINGDISKIGRQNAFSHAGENAAMPQSLHQRSELVTTWQVIELGLVVIRSAIWPIGHPTLTTTTNMVAVMLVEVDTIELSVDVVVVVVDNDLIKKPADLFRWQTKSNKLHKLS